MRRKEKRRVNEEKQSHTIDQRADLVRKQRCVVLVSLSQSGVCREGGTPVKRSWFIENPPSVQNPPEGRPRSQGVTFHRGNAKRRERGEDRRGGSLHGSEEFNRFKCCLAG